MVIYLAKKDISELFVRHAILTETSGDRGIPIQISIVAQLATNSLIISIK